MTRSCEINQYQIYGIGKGGEITHAGVHGLPRISQRAARKHQRKWEAWREGYLRTHLGDYPLRQNIKTEKLFIHPMGKPEKGIYIDL
jgi:hypothetical protein